MGEVKFIHIMLHSSLMTWKGNCYYSLTDVFVAVVIKIHNKVSFNIECFKNFLPFSIPLKTIEFISNFYKAGFSYQIMTAVITLIKVWLTKCNRWSNKRYVGTKTSNHLKTDDTRVITDNLNIRSRSIINVKQAQAHEKRTCCWCCVHLYWRQKQ